MFFQPKSCSMCRQVKISVLVTVICHLLTEWMIVEAACEDSEIPMATLCETGSIQGSKLLVSTPSSNLGLGCACRINANTDSINVMTVSAPNYMGCGSAIDLNFVNDRIRLECYVTGTPIDTRIHNTGMMSLVKTRTKVYSTDYCILISTTATHNANYWQLTVVKTTVMTDFDAIIKKTYFKVATLNIYNEHPEIPLRLQNMTPSLQEPQLVNSGNVTVTCEGTKPSTTNPVILRTATTGGMTMLTKTEEIPTDSLTHVFESSTATTSYTAEPSMFGSTQHTSISSDPQTANDTTTDMPYNVTSSIVSQTATANGGEGVTNLQVTTDTRTTQQGYTELKTTSTETTQGEYTQSAITRQTSQQYTQTSNTDTTTIEYTHAASTGTTQKEHIDNTVASEYSTTDTAMTIENVKKSTDFETQTTELFSLKTTSGTISTDTSKEHSTVASTNAEEATHVASTILPQRTKISSVTFDTTTEEWSLFTAEPLSGQDGATNRSAILKNDNPSQNVTKTTQKPKKKTFSSQTTERIDDSSNVGETIADEEEDYTAVIIVCSVIGMGILIAILGSIVIVLNSKRTRSASIIGAASSATGSLNRLSSVNSVTMDTEKGENNQMAILKPSNKRNMYPHINNTNENQ